MSLLNPVQIRYGMHYKNLVDDINQSYSATKVITTLQKPVQENSPVTYYTVDEYLQMIKNIHIVDETFTDEEVESIFQNS